MKFICLGTRCLTGGASMNAVLVAKALIAKGHECELWFLIRTGDLETDGIKTRVFSESTPKGTLFKNKPHRFYGWK